jgi:glycine cleavage system T protein
MSSLNKTFFNEKHRELGATLVDFGGWDMPVQYKKGVLREHLACRKRSGLFDVSHMGRFIISGQDALAFLQHVLTNNAAALAVNESQYTIIPDKNGYAIDDAYLYRFFEDSFLLVVNASNRDRDWRHFQEQAKSFKDLQLVDKTFEMGMLSVQGPGSKNIINSLIESGKLPIPMRNNLSSVTIANAKVLLARTGYTGDPLGFELFMDKKEALKIWDLLISKGVEPIGLGARDTLRLEACLPLYGHEFGNDPVGNPIPIFACPLAKFAVSLSPLKKEFIGKEALLGQFNTLKQISDFKYHDLKALPRIIMPVALSGRGIARQGCEVLKDGKTVGHITSGTMVPFWSTAGQGLFSNFTEESEKRAIALALLDADLVDGDQLEIKIRKNTSRGVIVPYHMRGEAPPRARAIMWDQLGVEISPEKTGEPLPNGMSQAEGSMATLVKKAIDNTSWRQAQCINLIPSEQVASSFSRMLSILDPSARYAEHKKVKAFCDHEVFYYQGTDFISEVESLLDHEIKEFLGCKRVESRAVSGQMANTAVFSALVDYFNRVDRKSEQSRIKKIMNNHILNGGHLSSQPMGALRDFVARDPKTEKPAVINFPVCEDNPYKIDVPACAKLIEIHKPQLIIFGKSMTIYPEPISQIRKVIDSIKTDTIVMYDMAHVLGLAGPYFQEPFKEGADLVTGSTHKTFFGTQRGIIAGDYTMDDPRYPLWEAIERRTFPGSVSNHHLGTMLGLLASAYEMNHFKDPYQKQILANARAFADALSQLGLKVAGEKEDGFTHTHQVIVDVGYSKGPAVADFLEKNNIIVNYQATPEEEGFTASGALRMGVSEMTRFGMREKDFQTIAQLMSDAILGKKPVKKQVVEFRKSFVDLHYCFDKSENLEGLMNTLHSLV